DERWVSAQNLLVFRVDFENLSAVAQAPAQVVDVRLPLDPNLDPTTFRLGSFGFGTHTIDVGDDVTTFDDAPYFGDLGLVVRVTAGIDIARREAFWTFSSIDPATGQPPKSPLIGFLPV